MTPEARGLELRVPPPLVWLVTGVAMWVATWLSPTLSRPFPGGRWFAVVFVLLGVVISVSGVRTVRSAGTTVNPHRPDAATALVSGGPYRVTRNPMYLGLALSLLGWAVFLSNALAVLLVAVFVWYLTQFQVKPEERALRAKFGAAYSAYAARVRRWV